MNRTSEYFKLCKELREAMRRVQREKGKALEKLEPYRGSAGYEADRKRVEEKAVTDRNALQNEYRGRFSELIGRMRDKLDAVTVTAPTDDELRILEVLRMRDKVTAEELTAAARSMRSELCFPVLEQIKRDSGILGVALPTSGKMPLDEAKRVLTELAKSADALCSMPVVDDREYYLRNPRYDAGAMEDGRRTAFFALDRDFDGESDCLVGCGGSVSSLDAFRAIVND